MFKEICYTKDMLPLISLGIPPLASNTLTSSFLLLPVAALQVLFHQVTSGSPKVKMALKGKH